MDLKTWLDAPNIDLHGQTVRISNGRRYCSGTLVAADLNATTEQISSSLVLTCAHFFRTAPIGAFYVRGRGLYRRLQAVRTIDGTDIAIALLQRPAPLRHLLGVGTQSLGPGMKTATLGYGGNKKYAVTKRGTVISPIPLSYSRGFETRVSPAAIQINTPKAIKGDSGGAVIALHNNDTQPSITAVQSLVLDPLGINLGLATAAQLPKHKETLYHAAQSLLEMQY